MVPSKPRKDSGYADSGADIAYTLNTSGFGIITPNQVPSTTYDLDWVFGDDNKQINSALDRGADTFWLNTVLFKEHPITCLEGSGICMVGQDPKMVDRYDDKYFTNRTLASLGFPVVVPTLLELDQDIHDFSSLEYPLVIKPIRGRGSQGVRLIENPNMLYAFIKEELVLGRFGTKFLTEPFLPGEELTVSVMPPGEYLFDKKTKSMNDPWCLPVIQRTGHNKGVVPYNGVTEVVKNSRLINNSAKDQIKIDKLKQDCVGVAKHICIRAPIRIDCRADKKGDYRMFDVNLKPNLTGKGRPGRENQDGLTTMAARGIGWTYKDLILNILTQRWRF